MHFPWFHITTLTPRVSIIAYGLFGIRCTARRPAASRFCRYDYSKDRISFRHSGDPRSPCKVHHFLFTTSVATTDTAHHHSGRAASETSKLLRGDSFFPVCIKRVRQGESKTRTVGDANNNSVGAKVCSSGSACTVSDHGRGGGGGGGSRRVAVVVMAQEAVTTLSLSLFPPLPSNHHRAVGKAYLPA